MAEQRIVVVDDDVLATADLASRLAALGYKICGQARCAEEALEHARGLTPDLMLINLQLQGTIAGGDAALLIRDGLGIPVVLATESRFAEIAARARLDLPCFILRKPINEGELAMVIESTLRRHREERARRERNRWLAAVVSGLGDGVVVVDAEGCVRYLNPAAEALIGWRIDQVQGRPFEEVVRLRHARTRQPLAGLVLSMLRPGEAAAPLTGALLLSADGTERPIEGTAGPFHDDAGQWQGGVLLLRDVGPRERLHAANQRAEKLEAIGRLASGVAHDYNNLLTIISGYAQIALGSLPVEHPAYLPLTHISSASDRAAELTRQFLAFGQQQRLRPQIVEVNALLGELEPRLREKLGAAITLALDCAADPGLVRIDRDLLEAMLLQLAANARAVLPEGGAVHLRTRNRVAPVSGAGNEPLPARRLVQLTWFDTRPRVEEAELARLGEPYSQPIVDGRGAGLTFAAAQGFIRQSGGTVEFEHPPHSGFAMHVYLLRL